MIRSLVLLSVGLVLAVTMSPAPATTIIARTPEQLAQQSALVVDGTVRGVRSYWNADHSKSSPKRPWRWMELTRGRAAPEVSGPPAGRRGWQRAHDDTAHSRGGRVKCSCF
jgi:hypothetical protein